MKTVFKGLLATLLLASSAFATNAQAATLGLNINTIPTSCYIWISGQGSVSPYFYNYGTYLINVPDGAFIQLTCQSSKGTTSWYGTIYGTKILYIR